MQITTTLLLACSTRASAGYTWENWVVANPCAVSFLVFIQRLCSLSSFALAYLATSSQWSSHCPTQTLLNDCISSACPALIAVQASASAAQSAQCSAYSRCAKVQDICTNAYPWWGSAWGWGGPFHGGLYTVTTESHTGLTTRTITTTMSGAFTIANQTVTLAAAVVVMFVM